MILVIGGQAAGKRTFVKKELGLGDDAIAVAVLDDKPVLADLHELVRRYDDDETLYAALLNKKAVLTNEVGAGIVPIDPAERLWRDKVGRLTARLAARADKVVRVCCGIPLVIKDKAK